MIRSYLQNNLRQCVLLFISLVSAGCVTAPSTYDYSALERNRPRSILVIPPINNSIEVDASYIYLSSVSRPLAEKGYYVFPVAVIDRFLKENGLPSPAEMNAVPLDKFRDIIGADAVLFVTIEDWGQKYQILTSVTVVHADLRLVDTRTGDLLWEARAQARVASDDADMGLFGAIVNALITQVARSISDKTFPVAQSANYIAVHNQSKGLLQGPYFNPEADQYWSAPVSDQNSAEKIGLGDETNLIYIGVAASEITAKTFDPNLWIKALALAEGNPEKQKGIYIKLRSEQLAEEKEEAEQMAKLAGDGGGGSTYVVDFSGTYSSEITYTRIPSNLSTRWYFGKRPRIQVKIKQQGDVIKATISGDRSGEIVGKVAGDIINYDFTMYAPGAQPKEGTGQWTLDDNLSSLSGIWSISNQSYMISGDWNLKKTGPSKLIAKNTSAAVTREQSTYNLTGTYRSAITSSSSYVLGKSRYQKLSFRLKQDGDKISGRSLEENIEISGTLNDNTVNFEIPPAPATGNWGLKGTWKISPDGKRLTGRWSQQKLEVRGKWEMEKIR